jgi:Flp pilus assembly protein TadB
VSAREQELRRARERRLAAERADARAESRRLTVRNVGLGMFAVFAVAAVVAAVLAVGTALGIVIGLMLVLVAIVSWAGRRPNRAGEQARETEGIKSFTH